MGDDKKKSHGPTSKRQRFLKLAGMTASVTGRFVKGQVKGMFQNKERREQEREAADAQNGALIARTLGELKGAAMKVGQLASMAKDILPSEVTTALTSLQSEAPPMDFEVIRQQIESELGSPPERLFDHFDPTPFASASIGQVHRARTDDGREVVVKVQYPGVDQSVDSDIAQLRFALRAGGLLRFRREAIDELFAELRDRLHEELDYTNEAENVRRFARLHADDAHLIIPEVVGERSSGRVLTLTYEPGDGLMTLDDKGYDQATRNLIAERLAHMLYKQIFELHAVHADPNPANFAFRPNGDVVLYDFGCVKVVPRDVVASYKQLMLAMIKADYSAMDRHMDALGFRVPGSGKPPESLYDAIRGALAPVFFTDGVYDFAHTRSHEAFTKAMVGGLKHGDKLQPSSKITFTDRAQGGQLLNLIKLRARINMHQIYMPYLHLPQQGEEGFEERMSKIPSLFNAAT